MTVKRKATEIQLLGDITTPTRAWTTDVPGLVVTAVTTSHRTLEGLYCLTHERSGARICNWEFPSVEMGLMFAERIKDWTDWTTSLVDLKKEGESKSFGKKLWDTATELEREVEKDPTVLVRKEGEDGTST